MIIRRLTLFLPAGFAAAFLLTACGPVRGYCAAASACGDADAVLDFVGSDPDSIDVCTAQTDGQIRTLTANEEQICRDEAQAFVTYIDCVARTFAANEKDACSGFRILHNGCETELNNYLSFVNNAGDKCSTGEKI